MDRRQLYETLVTEFYLPSLKHSSLTVANMTGILNGDLVAPPLSCVKLTPIRSVYTVSQIRQVFNVLIPLPKRVWFFQGAYPPKVYMLIML